MNKVDYLDMPVAYAMDQPIFFTHDILKKFIGMRYYQIDIGMWQSIITIEYTEKMEELYEST